jgi:tetratricopeptide (TPR) repeat protein
VRGPVGTLVFLVSFPLALASPAPEPHHAMPAPESHRSMPASGELLPGLGSYHHPISTRSPQAQKLFDQGLTLIYGFNHDEAIRSFQKAAKHDPGALMPLWGIAYALGPNINLPVDAEGEKKACDALQKALAAAGQAPENERAYVEALAKRYSDDPRADLNKLAVEYKDAMGEVAKRYPDDPDAATLYAESMMDLRPWQLWTLDGKPAPGTEDLVSVLESVLRRFPDHPGANHYYIHAVEASPHPEKALLSARRLEGMVPGAGHLVHMPAHIYARTGDYDGAVRRNEMAAQADRDYFNRMKVEGIYPVMYYGHNLQFLAYAAAMAGRYQVAKKAGDDLFALEMPALKEVSMVEFVLPIPLYVGMRFQKWDAVLASKEPPTSAPALHALWHFARSAAFAAKGKAEQAEAERKAFAEEAEKAPQDAPFSGTMLTSSGEILKVAAKVLDARIASARGDRNAAVDAWTEAVHAEDHLAYDEPPPWFYPIRESLGGELLRGGSYAEAEKIFREDLDRNPRNPRSLFGLAEALKGQGKGWDAGWVERQLKEAWKGEAPLKAENL